VEGLDETQHNVIYKFFYQVNDWLKLLTSTHLLMHLRSIATSLLLVEATSTTTTDAKLIASSAAQTLEKEYTLIWLQFKTHS
jgi:hypothetical protein